MGIFHYKIMITKILKHIINTILYLLAIIIVLVALQYLFSPVYDFPEPQPFSGKKWYNPYDSMNSTAWIKGNFQVQSRVWGGVTDGRKNPSKLIFEVYGKLGYEVIGISDYQKINKFGKDMKSYVPVYEHGYGIKKNHQVLIGAKKVLWRDYPLYQSLSHKQHILNLHDKRSELVYIAHPLLRHGYAPDDFKYLSGYDGIEVLNGYRISLEHWDAALSSGHYATILADDDAHDVTNPDEVGHYCTFINTPEIDAPHVIKALKKGNSFGADIPRPLGESYEAKAVKIKNLPVLKSVNIYNDTLGVEVSKEANDIRFIGQDGVLRHAMTNTGMASYKLNADDTYIRVEIFFPGDVRFYLNPIARCDGDCLDNPTLATTNKTRTILKRALSIIFVLMVIFLFLSRKKRHQRTKIVH